MSKVLNILFLTFAFLALISAVAYAEGEAVVADAGAEKQPDAAAEKQPADAAAKGDEAEAALPVATGAAKLIARAPRSLLQACRKEINRVCPEKKAIVKCLSSKVDEIKDEECKTWVVARDVCTKAASKNSKCTAKDSPRQCLRKVTASELPEECTSSDFYKSVKMFSMFKRNPGKSGLLAKIGGQK